MRAVLAIAGGFLLLTVAAHADAKKDWAECAGSDDDLAIAGCTRLIERGKETRVNLAIARSNRGSSFQRKGELDTALADLDEAVRLDPKRALSYYNRGVVQNAKGAYDLAIDDYSKYIELEPKDADGYLARADPYASKQDFEHALADYDEAIKLRPDSSPAYAGRGWVLGQQGKDTEAIAAYDEVLRLDPENADALNDRGWHLARTQAYDRAIADFTEAVRIKPDHPQAIHNRGWTYWMQNDLDKALADLDQALQIAPGDVGVLITRGAVFSEKEDYDSAIAEYDKVLAQKPDAADALNGRAWAYAQKGELDKALVDAERSVALESDASNTIHTRAWIYREKGMLDLALADFDKAIGLNPDSPALYADRGRISEIKGERDKAIADYRKSLSLKSLELYDDKAKAEALKHLTTLAAATPGNERKPAPGPQAPEKRIALVIGNSAYSNVQALKNADSDARAVAVSLRRLGFEVVEKRDLTLGQLVAELKAFGDRAPQYDWAVVYYAGHGIEVGGINYLIPIDAALSASSHVNDEALPLDRVLAKVEGAQKLRLVILDACRENPFVAKMASAGGTRGVGRGLARIEPSAGVLVAYSAKDGQVAQDGDGTNSPFAEALLERLNEPGLEISMLFRKVHDDVKKRTHGEQIPFTYGALPADPLYFKAAP